MTSSCDALVVGAGGFLGGHLVRSLLLQGLQVRAVDIRPVDRWSQRHDGADNRTSDLAVVQNAVAATSGATTVYDLAAAPHVDRMTGVLTDTHLLLAARETGVDRFVLASSAVDVPPALAAAPDDGGWRRLFAERMARHVLEDVGVQTRVARLGPVYGAHAHPGGGAVVVTVARSIATAVATGARVVEIPYRAEDPASQVYVDDAVLGLQLIAHGTDDCGPHVVVDPAPLTVREVVDTVLAVAGARLDVRYTGTTATPTVVGDPGALAQAVDWQPDIPLRAAVAAFWSTVLADVRRDLDLQPDACDRWTRRRAAAAGVGRHRYENAG